MTRKSASFHTLRPGRLSYRAGLALQEQLLQEAEREQRDLLLLLEHPPTITLGRGARLEHLLTPPGRLAQLGIELHRVGRGGDITYHGPGQLVGYPLVNLAPGGRDLHRYLRQLEELLIRVLTSWGIDGSRRQGKTGIWVGDMKIASIGIGVRHWISWHGFALNLSADQAGFDHIVPCGLQGVRMTSMEEQLGQPVARREVEEVVIASFADTFSSTYAGPHVSETTTQA